MYFVFQKYQSAHNVQVGRAPVNITDMEHTVTSLHAVVGIFQFCSGMKNTALDW